MVVYGKVCAVEAELGRITIQVFSQVMQFTVLVTAFSTLPRLLLTILCKANVILLFVGILRLKKMSKEYYHFLFLSFQNVGMFVCLFTSLCALINSFIH
jgi:hypothetical protein